MTVDEAIAGDIAAHKARPTAAAVEYTYACVVRLADEREEHDDLRALAMAVQEGRSSMGHRVRDLAVELARRVADKRGRHV